MPITKSVKKSLRSSEIKRERNAKAKKNLKQLIKKVDSKNINQVVSAIDKAAKNNLIHENKAARLKSNLAKNVKAEPKTGSTASKNKTAKKTTKKKTVTKK